ncbi:MAG: hypothetical protein WCI02_03650 [Planctomycetota bacterium]|jgi:uncharacterized membrane protein YhaH (DUF805 family)
MKRYRAFLRETWWLWCLFVVMTLLLMIFIHPIFVVILPMMIVNFFYFALVRYDEDGNFIGA